MDRNTHIISRHLNGETLADIARDMGMVRAATSRIFRKYATPEQIEAAEKLRTRAKVEKPETVTRTRPFADEVVGRFNMSLPTSLHARFMERCAEQGIPASWRLAELMAEDIGYGKDGK